MKYLLSICLVLCMSCVSQKNAGYTYKEPLPIEKQMEEEQKKKDKENNTLGKVIDISMTTVGAVIIGVIAIFMFN